MRVELEPHKFQPCDYGKHEGIWYALSPNSLLANLASHKVIEHDDGTISVTPSILVSNNESSWHGYITNGRFIEC